MTGLEALNKIQHDFGQLKGQELVSCYETIFNALKRLESIDNANHSEALECLEKLNGMEISSMPFSDEYGTQEVDLNDIRKVGSQLNTDFREYTATIKQALIKAEKEHKALDLLMQELDCKDFAELRKYARCGYEKLNKKYLKWEDLDFKKEEQTMKVKMGDTHYLLTLRIGLTDVKSVVLRDNNLKPFLHLFEKEKQLFNDLHLERVEE